MVAKLIKLDVKPPSPKVAANDPLGDWEPKMTSSSTKMEKDEIIKIQSSSEESEQSEDEEKPHSSENYDDQQTFDDDDDDAVDQTEDSTQEITKSLVKILPDYKKITFGIALREVEDDYSSPQEERKNEKLRLLQKAFVTLRRQSRKQRLSINRNMRRVEKLQKAYREQMALRNRGTVETRKELLAEILTIQPPVVKAIAERMLELKSKKRLSHQFPQVIMSFALKLHLLSPRAYILLRRTFKNCLPAKDTLSQIYRNLDEESRKALTGIVNMNVDQSEWENEITDDQVDMDEDSNESELNENQNDEEGVDVKMEFIDDDDDHHHLIES